MSKKQYDDKLVTVSSIKQWIESDEGKKHSVCGMIRIDKLIEFLNDGKSIK